MSEPDPRLPDASELQRTAADVATRAAAIVRAALGAAVASGTKSSVTDVVTETDVAVESFIRSELTSAFPGSSIVGEELADVDGSSGIGWVVDPIDGTVNFVYDLPVIAVSIAATVHGRVVAGAVADIVREETFAAAAGHGAYRNNKAVAASTADDLGLSLVATGFSYDAALRAEQAKTIARLLPLTRDVRCMGSAALNLCWVACGRLDAYYERDLKPYDYAAGLLIAAEAGAVVERPEDRARWVVASAAGIAPSLRSVLQNGE
ncbi:MAG: inositol monophosphatase family protein [Actinomycetota bacterium]